MSRRKPLSGIVRFGSLRRVSQVTLIQGNVWKELSLNLKFRYKNKLSSPCIYEKQYQGPLKASSSLLPSWCIDPLSLHVDTRQ